MAEKSRWPSARAASLRRRTSASRHVEPGAALRVGRGTGDARVPLRAVELELQRLERADEIGDERARAARRQRGGRSVVHGVLREGAGAEPRWLTPCSTTAV